MAYENLLTVREAAERMGCSAQTVYTMVRAREIAHHRIGGRIMIDIGDLDRYVLLQSRTPARGEHPGPSGAQDA